MGQLSFLGAIVAVGLIWYGRKTGSDARILGYILIAPSLFGLYQAYGGPSLDTMGKTVTAGAPNDGAALPSRRSVAPQLTFESGKMDSREFGVPNSGAAKFGGLAMGGSKVTFDSTSEPEPGDSPADFSSSLAPPGSAGRSNFKKGW